MRKARRQGLSDQSGTWKYARYDITMPERSPPLQMMIEDIVAWIETRPKIISMK